MHYLISGLAKSGTTFLFSQLRSGLLEQGLDPATHFEPDTEEALRSVLGNAAPTLSKVLIGRVDSGHSAISGFDRHVMIYRDPRDQFISMLLYLFYDFQLSGDLEGYRRAREALADKVRDPHGVSTIELYNTVAAIVGRGPVRVFARLHAVQKAFREAFRPHAVKYEALLDREAVPGLEEYLGFPLTMNARVPEQYGRVARSKSYGDWRKWLNDEDLAFIDSAWGDTIASLGYERALTSSKLGIDTRTSLDYVAQFEPGVVQGARARSVE